MSSCSQRVHGDTDSPTGPPTERRAHFLHGDRRQRRHRLRQLIVCVPFADCPNGTGYVQICCGAGCEADGPHRDAHATSSVPGAVLSPGDRRHLARDIGGRSTSRGNFIEQQAPFVPTDYDARHDFRGRQRRQHHRARRPRGPRRQRHPRRRTSTRRSVSGAPTSRIWSRASAPARRTRASSRSTCPTSPARRTSRGNPTLGKELDAAHRVGLSDRINALTAQNVLVVDLMCDARALSAVELRRRDGFHPATAAIRCSPADVAGAARRPNTPPTTTAPSGGCSPSSFRGHAEVDGGTQRTLRAHRPECLRVLGGLRPRGVRPCSVGQNRASICTFRIVKSAFLSRIQPSGWVKYCKVISEFVHTSCISRRCLTADHSPDDRRGHTYGIRSTSARPSRASAAGP